VAGYMDFVKVVNRTTRKLEGMFDGVPIDLPPGYLTNLEGKVVPAGENGEPAFKMLPHAAAERLKWQNPQMGTADPEVPTDVEFMVGVESWGDDISYLPATDAVELLDRSLLGDEAQTATTMTTNKGRSDKKGRRQRYSDGRLKNLVMGGAKADYND
jgi:hypothetical protein